MTREENECLVALREKSYHGLNIIEASRLGELERKKEIDESDWKVDSLTTSSKQAVLARTGLSI